MLINGTPNDDNLRGTAENDSLIGSGGDDRLAGAGGNDFLNGGFGDDTLLGGVGNDTITFGAGAKLVDGGPGEDTINLNFTRVNDDFTLLYNSTDGGVTSEGILSGTRIEGIEELNVRSGAGDDAINISGASLGSVVSTGRGDDLIIGGQGDDRFVTSSGDDTVSGNEGDDTIIGGFGDDILNGESGDDVITFGAGANTVNGGGGEDRLELDFSSITSDIVFTYNQFEEASLTEGGILDGTEVEAIEQINFESGSGDDLIDIAVTEIGGTLMGGAGFDSLIGGLGDDTLLGGAGNDIYFGSAGSDSIDGGGGAEDVAVFAGDAEDYEITFEEDLITLEIGDDIDTLVDIDFLRFEDGDINVETEVFTPIEEIGARADEIIDAAEDLEEEVENAESEDDEEEEDTEDEETVADDDEDDADEPEAVTEDEEEEEEDESEDDEDVEDEDVEDAEEPEAVAEDEDEEEEDESEEEDITETAFTNDSNGSESEEDADAELDGDFVYQLTRNDNQSQFYTTSESTRDSVLAAQPEYELGNDSFIGADAPVDGDELAGVSPVYGFFNTSSEAYLYTSAESERDFITENLDNYVPEGIAFYSFDTQVEGSIPLYRVYNAESDTHSFTTSASQRDSFVESGDFVTEGDENGIAFYVEPATDV
ncbi:MAG: hypothetical protein AAFQ41_09020 [Cyanobacteria bacterium J06623_7]